MQPFGAWQDLYDQDPDFEPGFGEDEVFCPTQNIVGIEITSLARISGKGT